MASAPGRSGARRPENRVTARSKLPQKKCTALDFPINPALNWLKSESTENKIRQNFSTELFSAALAFSLERFAPDPFSPSRSQSIGTIATEFHAPTDSTMFLYADAPHMKSSTCLRPSAG